MASPILVTGGTETLGRLVVKRLRDAGRAIRVLTRRSGLDQQGIEFVTGDPTTGSATSRTMSELLCAYLDARGKHRPLIPVRLPGGAARAVRGGANLAPE